MGTRSIPRRGLLRLHFLAGALACAASLSGCAGRNAENPFDDDRPPGSVRIVVINHDFNDATLHAVGDGQRRRLGVVTGKSEANYIIPWRLVGPLQIEISVLAAGACTTDALQVEPGETLELQILTENVRGGRCSGPRGLGG
jgi:hypothetical protein